MKKITITLGSNESKFTTMVDDATALKVFGDTISSLLDNADTTNEPKKEIKKNDVVDRLTKCDKQPAVDVIVDNGRIIVPPTERLTVPTNRSRVERLFGAEYGNKPTNYTPYKDIDRDRAYLCFYRCTECGKSFFKMAKYEEEGTCSCGKEFVYNKFTNASYRCDCCGFEGIFKVIGDTEPTEINCKGCSSPIDMKYNDDKHKWQSLNMFR